MDRMYEERVEVPHNTRNFLLGMIIGVVAGAAAMLLFAPQSGKQTRGQIQSKGNQIRDWTTKLGRKAISHVRTDTREIASSYREKTGYSNRLGIDKSVGQMSRPSASFNAANTTIKAA